jgi:hypothetical protein
MLAITRNVRRGGGQVFSIIKMVNASSTLNKI